MGRILRHLQSGWSTAIPKRIAAGLARKCSVLTALAFQDITGSGDCPRTWGVPNEQECHIVWLDDSYSNCHSGNVETKSQNSNNYDGTSNTSDAERRASKEAINLLKESFRRESKLSELASRNIR